MYSKQLNKLDHLLTQVIRNKHLIDYAAQMTSDLIRKETNGEWSQQDVINALEALYIGLEKKYQQFNK